MSKTPCPQARLVQGPSGSGEERAFTLIELLIGMVLIGILGALVFQGLIGGLGGASQASADRRATAEFQQARELLVKDLRSAQAPGRDFDEISSRLDLRDELITGTSALPAGTDVADIKMATPTTLTFVADVRNTDTAGQADHECVTWQLQQGGGKWWVSRDVQAYVAGCPSGGTGAYVIKPQPITAETPAPSSIFSYTSTCAASSCGAGYTCAGGAPVGNVAGLAMNWITGVRLDMGALVRRHDAAAKGRLVSAVAIRGRLGDDYLYSLGCLEQQ